jgi:uncharacterized membrane protein
MPLFHSKFLNTFLSQVFLKTYKEWPPWVFVSAIIFYAFLLFSLLFFFSIFNFFSFCKQQLKEHHHLYTLHVFNYAIQKCHAIVTSNNTSWWKGWHRFYVSMWSWVWITRSIQCWSRCNLKDLDSKVVY